MAFTLKTTGIATGLVALVAVDEDGTTVKEFVSSDVNSNMTLTNVSVGAGSWKGTTRGYFSCTGSGSTFGPLFASGHRPNVSGATGFSVFLAFHSLTGDTQDRVIIGRGGASLLSIKDVETIVGLRPGPSSTAISTSAKSSSGHKHKSGVIDAFWYGLESGSMSADGSVTDEGYGGGSYDIEGIGGASSQVGTACSLYCVALFNTLLSEAEFQSLHGNGTNDWTTTLFESGGGGGSSNGAAAYYYAQQ